MAFGWSVPSSETRGEFELVLTRSLPARPDVLDFVVKRKKVVPDENCEARDTDILIRSIPVRRA